VEEAGVPGENHRPWASNFKPLNTTNITTYGVKNYRSWFGTGADM